MQKSIIVIADDFTGAAELAGISLQFGLKLPIYLNVQQIQPTELSAGCIICTNSRSMPYPEAMRATKEALEWAKNYAPAILYKKIDSVLRGYVWEELQLQMQVMGFQKGLIAPANPTLGRVIKEGIYYIHDQPIAQTGFANDPEFPIASSSVKEILGNQDMLVLSSSEPLPDEGIFLAEAASMADTEHWAQQIDSLTCLAGAGDFYTALLAKHFKRSENQLSNLQIPFLLVVGSAFESAQKRVLTWKAQARSAIQLPPCFELIEMKDQVWVLAIQAGSVKSDALELRTQMAWIVKDLVLELNIQELVVEGGSTAGAILNEMAIQQLLPVNELSRGMVRMQAEELFLTVKPGSYPLPGEIEKIISNHRFK